MFTFRSKPKAHLKKEFFREIRLSTTSHCVRWPQKRYERDVSVAAEKKWKEGLSFQNGKVRKKRGCEESGPAFRNVLIAKEVDYFFSKRVLLSFKHYKVCHKWEVVSDVITKWKSGWESKKIANLFILFWAIADWFKINLS